VTLQELREAAKFFGPKMTLIQIDEFLKLVIEMADKFREVQS
jgi:hypothetical protein